MVGDMLWNLWSQLLGVLDYLVAWIFRLSEERYCRHGMGNIDVAERLKELQLEPKAAEVEFIEKSDPGVKEGRFTSQLAEYLPEESKTAYFLMVEPPQGVALKGLVVSLPSNGDKGYGMRKKFAEPLTKEGYVSVILMGAYYAKRKPKGQKGHYILTASDWLLCASANFFETANLILWAEKTYPGLPLGISGLSFGGSMAMYASLYIDRPLAVSTMIASAGPHVITRGLFYRQMDWPSIAKGLNEERDARQQLDEIFVSYSLRKEVIRMGISKKPQLAVVAVTAPHDYILSPECVVEMSTLQKSIAAVYEERKVPGGHVSSFFRRADYADAIRRSFTLLAELQAET